MDHHQISVLNPEKLTPIKVSGAMNGTVPAGQLCRSRSIECCYLGNPADVSPLSLDS